MAQEYIFLQKLLYLLHCSNKKVIVA